MAAAGFSGVHRGRSMLKIAVLDDEKVFCDAIKRKLHSIYKKMQVVASVDEYHFGRELLYEVDDGAYYDIYLLDINLPDMSGMELARKLREIAPYSYIIFLTVYPQFAIEGYDARAYQYLLKDEWEHKLAVSLDKIQKEMSEDTGPSYCIAVGSQYRKIPVRWIYHIHKDGKNSVFVTKDGKSSIRKSLAAVFEELPMEEFMYVDRGSIVNIQHILKLKDNEIYLSDGEILPVSGPQLGVVKKRLNAYWRKHV